MADHDVYIRCPVCQAGLKVAAATVTDGQMSFDTIPGPSQRHLAMHHQCTCEYVEPSGDRITETTCTLHGGPE